MPLEHQDKISFNIPNKFWVDENTQPANVEEQIGDSLEPGDDVVLSQIESTTSDLQIQPRAVGTSMHVGDIFNDGTRQSILNYVYERKYRTTDDWVPMKGLTSPLPYGTLSDPTEIVPGTFLEPMQAFRVRVENRTDQTENQFSVGANELGALISGIVVREGHDE